jgi:hypothetical protein
LRPEILAQVAEGHVFEDDADGPRIAVTLYHSDDSGDVLVLQAEQEVDLAIEVEPGYRSRNAAHGECSSILSMDNIDVQIVNNAHNRIAVTNIDREISENAEHKVKDTSTLCRSEF